MSKSIPVALQTHKNQPVNTTAFLLRIVKNTGATGATEVVRFTSLDADITYDVGAGDGAQVFKSSRGFDPSSLENTGDLAVDNADGLILLDSGSLDPVAVAEIDAGRFDAAEFAWYSVNWKDLSLGHEMMLFGTIGQARVIHGGMACAFELRGQSQKLKQNVGYRDTKDCPARFGSQSGDERLYCGFDATTLLITGTVTGVGAEITRVFTGSALAQANDFFVPGMVFWTGGRNAGTSQEIEDFVSGGIVSLRFDCAYPITIGDAFNIRRDCNKRARDAAKGCKHFHGAQWVNNFRGCPDIPTGDSAALQTPGAASPPRNVGLIGELEP